MRMQIQKTYLKFTAFGIAAFGPVFFLGTMEPTMEVARLSLDILTWPVDGYPTYSSNETRFLSALTGGFLFGWGVLVWILSGRIFDAEPEAVRKAVMTSLIAWFFLDSAGSIASGMTPNALFNVLVLLIFMGPLWFKASDLQADK